MTLCIESSMASYFYLNLFSRSKKRMGRKKRKSFSVDFFAVIKQVKLKVPIRFGIPQWKNFRICDPYSVLIVDASCGAAVTRVLWPRDLPTCSSVSSHFCVHFFLHLLLSICLFSFFLLFMLCLITRAPSKFGVSGAAVLVWTLAMEEPGPPLKTAWSFIKKWKNGCWLRSWQLCKKNCIIQREWIWEWRLIMKHQNLLSYSFYYVSEPLQNSEI